jgi:glyoxylase-like metal-dependent hydrolase (beta-lactamase superfamily II)
LESGRSRILLDLGLPLDAPDLASTPLPKIEGLGEGSSTLLAIVLSHGHRDHWGLIPKVNPQIPLVMGRATESIIRAAADFVPEAVKLNAAQYLEHGKPIQLHQGSRTHPVPSDSGLATTETDTNFRVVQMVRASIQRSIIALSADNRLA